ncbi:MAG: Rid family detoxifying hydrolase [Actinomycetota bacterium]|nr:Rid family detoxifying hydrolase [Actinomycetota bacterium]
MFDVISTDEAPQAVGHYSQGIKAGGFAFVSGQIPLDVKTGELIAASLYYQTLLALRNIEAVLRAAGSSVLDVVKVTVYMLDLSEFNLVNEAFAEVFTNTPPARETVQVSGLPGGAQIEISAIAKLS